MSGLKKTFIKRYIVERTSKTRKTVRKRRVVERIYGMFDRINLGISYFLRKSAVNGRLLS